MSDIGRNAIQPNVTFPLTPGQALAVAAIVSTHPNQLPHWAGWAEALRTWAAAEFDASQPVDCGNDTMGYYDDEDDVECTCDQLAHPCEVHDCRGGAPDEVRGPDWTPNLGREMEVVDLVAALRASVEAAKARRAAGETR